MENGLTFEWNNQKAIENLAKHNCCFELVREFDFTTALVVKDDRFDYSEARWIASGFINARLYILIFTTRNTNIRVISLRKANKRERKYYEKQS